MAELHWLNGYSQRADFLKKVAHFLEVANEACVQPSLFTWTFYPQMWL